MKRVVALVAARDEADLIADTVSALRSLADVTDVVVVDDGSRDDTASRALAAGAAVLRLERPRGKGRALEGALRRLAPADAWLLADGDLGASAAALGAVLDPVLACEADLAIAVFPPGQGGGLGIVKRAAARAIAVLGHHEVLEPLSGQRALSAEALDAVRPLANGFGVETAMTIDAGRADLRVLEVPAPLSHREGRRDVRGFAHRGRQGWDILRAVVPEGARVAMRWGRLLAANHRGDLVPRTLGLALAASAAVATLLVAALDEVGAAGWGALAGCLLVVAAGLVDDLAPAGPRGLRNHLRSLADGHMTTGLLKALVIAGAAAVVVVLQGPWAPTAGLSAIVLLAASANVWNGLDVRPGRAIKAFLPPALAFVVWGELVHAPAIAGLFAGALLVLPLDLRERAMLGDSGSNLLGFAAGLALADVLPGAWMPVAAAVAVGLNVVADTVSFSRVIEATPPLRFVDALGRRP